MEHATQYHIGHDQQPAGRRAGAAQTNRRVRRLDEQAEGCRTGGDAAAGFLKCSFLPKLEQTEAIKNFCAPAKERDFYKSLSRLADHYGIETIPSGAYEYPYNIALTMQDVRQKLRKKVSNWQQLRLIRQGRKTYLISEERYDTGSTLYYIPVLPLYRMCQSRQRRRTALLLVSVCAYRPCIMPRFSMFMKTATYAWER